MPPLVLRRFRPSPAAPRRRGPLLLVLQEGTPEHPRTHKTRSNLLSLTTPCSHRAFRARHVNKMHLLDRHISRHRLNK